MQEVEHVLPPAFVIYNKSQSLFKKQNRNTMFLIVKNIKIINTYIC